MPRISKRRGKTSTKRGINSHKVCILSAMDDHEQCIFLVQGVGMESKERADSLLSYITRSETKETVFITDMKQIYGDVVKNINRKHIEIKAECHVNDEGYSLSGINQLHSEFSNIYKRYRGVSIRHLQGYLDFFSYCKNLTYHFSKIKQRSYRVYSNTSKETSYLKKRDVCRLPLPIDLFEAYGDWQFGCFAL